MSIPNAVEDNRARGIGIPMWPLVLISSLAFGVYALKTVAPMMERTAGRVFDFGEAGLKATPKIIRSITDPINPATYFK